MQKLIITTLVVVSYVVFFSAAVVNADPIGSKLMPIKEKDSTEQAAEEKRLLQRVEMQVKRLATDYNFTEEQTQEAIKIFADCERQINELRTQINVLSKEKMEKFNAIVTPEQKKVKEEADKLKREQMKATRDSIGLQDRGKFLKPGEMMRGTTSVDTANTDGTQTPNKGKTKSLKK